MVAYSSVVHINLILCRLITFLKRALVGAYLIIIAHGLCSSGIFYLVNLYYERSGRRLSVLGSISIHVSRYMYRDTFCVSNLYLRCIQIRVFVFVSR
ncbi:NADH-ubiquinone oxidoreductase chain 4 [Trachymyrmex cornetzi]|uniref:NADH:ubiquinone reductase (H(+)-translocating) n=1 Tax=Trachymyrmex cornetzi TaxID=471704 RepID=A0A151J7M8_9HYME|nr:NADH-ubiquinone oxidoreductase chain 4 [Trachymyrmex cornetzi]